MTTMQHNNLPVEPSARTFQLAQLVSLIREGRARIPHFQRGLRWGTKDAVALIDSVLRGFPIGSLLLWRKAAPAERIQLGDVTIDASALSDALYVVDGQQRLTTFLNVFDPEAGLNGDFALVYDLATQPPRVRPRSRSDNDEDVIPLPVLFDLRSVLRWVADHPQHTERIDVINAATQRLREFHVPAYEVHSEDDSALREIYDRMNNTGKRLTRAEVFHGLFSSVSNSATPTTLESIQEDLRDSTGWGRIDRETIFQVLLARRGHDVSRDIHHEFNNERRKASEFPAEDREEAHAQALRALERTISFLRDDAKVPHFTFLAYRFLLVVLARFFAHFPEPHHRNRELLHRWYWRTALIGPSFAGGSSAYVRKLTQLIQPGEEDDSVQRLLATARDAQRQPIKVGDFRTNRASGQIMLCALWALEPRSPDTGAKFTLRDLAQDLDEASTPAPACPEVYNRKVLPEEFQNSLGNRVIAPGLPLDVAQGIPGSTEEAVRDSHLFTGVDVHDPVHVVRQREQQLQKYLDDFLKQHARWQDEDSPPLDHFIFDDEFEESLEGA